MGAILDLPEMRARVHRWTVADYRRLTEDVPAFRRAELIRGVIFERPPKSPRHVFLTERLFRHSHAAIHGGLTVWQYRPLQLADSVPEPDVAVVRGAHDDFCNQHPTTAELVVEVAVSSIAPDRENASLYAEAGVTEYWIVLGETEQVEVYRRPVEGIYLERRTYGRGEIIEGVGVTAQAVPVDALFA